MPSHTETTRKTRSLNGNPRPYFDKSSNRWRAVGYYQDKDGKRKSVRGSGKTKQAAATSRDQLIKDRIRSEKQSTSEVTLNTVAEWVDHYMNVHRSGDWEYSTRVGYEHVVSKWINPSFGKTSLAEFKYEQLEKLYSQMTKAGYSRSTLNQIHSLLKPAFAEAVRRGYIPFNPIDQVNLPKKTKSLPVYLTYEETRKVLAEAERQNELASWGIALGMGLRQGERLALKWKDVDLDSPNPHLVIRNTLQRQTGRGLVLKRPKTVKSQRTLGLTPELVSALKQRRAIQNADRLKAGSDWIDSGFIFTTATGNPIDPRNDNRNWAKVLRAAGVTQVKLHVARHTAATLMVTGGTPIHTVSELLGHCSIVVTADIYAHVRSAQVTTALNQLSSGIFPVLQEIKSATN